MIPKKYLLLPAGLVWGAAGFNILRLGLTAIIYILAFLRISSVFALRTLGQAPLPPYLGAFTETSPSPSWGFS